MSEVRKSRKRKPELFEGDGVRILPTDTKPERTGTILMKDGSWCVVELFDSDLDENGYDPVIWIKLNPR